ncbi:TPA: hypothetical protein OT180_002225 [Morganella morganii]|nr:hypothetical protein [Morganella morganii]
MTDKKNIIFDFFYAFSRLEFLLKKHKFYYKLDSYDNAGSSWKEFIKKNKERLNEESVPSGGRLLSLAPGRQVISVVDGEKIICWSHGGYTVNEDGSDYLDQVIFAIKAVRNNLFHGGKELGDIPGGVEYDELRDIDLLQTSTLVITQIVKELGWDSEFSFQQV